MFVTESWDTYLEEKKSCSGKIGWEPMGNDSRNHKNLSLEFSSAIYTFIGQDKGWLWFKVKTHFSHTRENRKTFLVILPMLEWNLWIMFGLFKLSISECKVAGLEWCFDPSYELCLDYSRCPSLDARWLVWKDALIQVPVS